MKRCGLYIRVSTDRQAKVEEGSLKNQDQFLTQHVELKNKMNGEQWIIVERYVDEGRSAKDTKGRPAYLRMVEDIRQGRINTVLCMALSRISRSTRDLLDMIEFFKAHDVDFICLKEDYDTTTAQGKCFVTIMGALNEFEREQTSERTRAAFLARAERGLWNGGQIIGYDLDPQRKGSLIPHPKEAEIISRIFDTYLACGSILETAKRINAQGYRTRAYTGRRGVHHSEEPFCYSATQQILTNHAYIGRKEINKKIRHQPQDKLPEELRYHLVDAVWPSIVPAEKFFAAQKLMQVNLKHKWNGAVPTKHFYLFNGGLLHCSRCGTRMEGRNAYGKRGTKAYYYYVCANAQCRFKLPEAEVERSILELVRYFASKSPLLAKVVARLNVRLQQRLPKLSAQRRGYQEELQDVNRKAGRLLDQYAGEANGGGVFLKETLDQLAARRRELEGRLAMVAASESEITDRALGPDDVRTLVAQFEGAFSDSIKPYKRRELVYKVLRRVELSGENIRLGIDLAKREVVEPDSSPVARSHLDSKTASGSQLEHGNASRLVGLCPR